MEVLPQFITRVYVFDTLADANASNKLFGWGSILMIKGDNTRYKLAIGQKYSGTEPSGATSVTFASLPWTNTNGAANSPVNPYAANVTATLTAAQLAQGYITSTSAAAVGLTLPTATLLGEKLNAVQGTVFNFTVDNSAGANAVTVIGGAGITAAGAGTLVVAVGAIVQFKIIFETPTTALLYTVSTAKAADVAAITDSSTGTPGSAPFTLAAVTNPDLSSWDGATVFPSAAQGTAINAAITSLKNAVAMLAAQNNLMRTALVNAGLMA